jgi:outer membrane lipoprotein carrier protein
MKKLLIAIVSMAFVSIVFAETPESRLNRALAKLDSITADFVQTVLDDDQQIVQQSQGTVALQRPGKFAWVYATPYEQKIIGDGKELWVYDVDLDQVTVKPLDNGLATAPIMVLMKKDNIGEQFIVSEIGQKKFLYWVELEPVAKDMEYSHVYLGIDDTTVKAMQLRDSFGQSTQIVFENLRTDVIHNPTVFEFIPPPGVDVFAVDG